LEAVETRYTGEWKVHLPELLRKNNIEVEVIEGPTDIPPATTPGAFLNFGGTNVYKAAQVEKISRLFCAGAVTDGSYFLFADAWHPGIINLKYMAELLGIKIKIGALWHAGSYDPADFLGRLIGDKPWVRYAEKSFYHAIDHNYFATDFHVQLFGHNLLGWPHDMRPANYRAHTIIRTGWPMEYITRILKGHRYNFKSNLVVFPHRIAPEKQVDIFRDLAKELPEFEFVVCQDKQLTKEEYHALLGRAKIVFSASLQETLGIGCFEGAVCGAFPMVPNRLSYTEMYSDQFRYPSIWTENWDSYIRHREELKGHIRNTIENYEAWKVDLNTLAINLQHKFFSCDNMIQTIKECE
jgi:glycosyltransferase involved in cell wall biosynthesis